jgi:hypothetical protein
MKEFADNGLIESDVISKDTWFLKDVLRMYGGDMGATMTPGESMNLQA